MELSIGKTLTLKRDFVNDFADNRTTRSFRVTALTDKAVGLVNAKSGQSFTLSISTIASNVENTTLVQSTRKPKIVVDIKSSLAVPELPKPTTTKPSTVVIHTAPPSDGGINVTGTSDIEEKTKEDSASPYDPFSGLYG